MIGNKIIYIIGSTVKKKKKIEFKLKIYQDNNYNNIRNVQLSTIYIRILFVTTQTYIIQTSYDEFVFNCIEKKDSVTLNYNIVYCLHLMKTHTSY